jgi:flagellar hook-associated protein 1
MSTLFGILETGSRALFSQQIGLAVTGNNIANVNTPGFSRQRVNLVTTADIRVPPRPQGQGVKVALIDRFRSAFLDTQIRQEKSNLGYLDRLIDVYNQMETIYNDPIALPASSIGESAEAGLNASLINFFDAVQELSLEPENVGIRSALMETAQTLSETFQQIQNQSNDLLVQINNDIADVLDQANSILEQIFAVNQQIARLEIDETANANNLRDQRDLLVTELSELLPIEVEELETGAINVRVFGINAVQPLSLKKIIPLVRPNSPEGFVDITMQEGQGMILNSQVESGALGGLLEARDKIVPQFQERLDLMAHTLIGEINQIHSNGSGIRGYSQATGLFAVNDPSLVLDAAQLDFPIEAGTFEIVVRDLDGEIEETYSIAVDPAVDTLNDLAARIDQADGVIGGGQLVASVNSRNELVISTDPTHRLTFQNDNSGALAALGVNVFFTGMDASSISVNSLLQNNLDLVAASANGTPGNNEIALEMAQLREAQVFNNGTADFNEYYQSTIAIMGTQGRRVMQLQSSTSLLVDSLEIRQEDLAGVSIDEETVNLIKFQRAFAAASRFITSIDELAENVIQRMGIVGR